MFFRNQKVQLPMANKVAFKYQNRLNKCDFNLNSKSEMKLGSNC